MRFLARSRLVKDYYLAEVARGVQSSHQFLRTLQVLRELLMPVSVLIRLLRRSLLKTHGNLPWTGPRERHISTTCLPRKSDGRHLKVLSKRSVFLHFGRPLMIPPRAKHITTIDKQRLLRGRSRKT